MIIDQVTIVGYPPNIDINLYTDHGKITFAGVESFSSPTESIALDFVFQAISNLKKEHIPITIMTTEDIDNLMRQVRIALEKPDSLGNTVYTMKCKFINGL